MLALAAVLLALTAPIGNAAPGGNGPKADPPGDRAHDKIEDHRSGRAAPRAQQQRSARSLDATVRFNDLGTPSVVLPTTAEPLASGLGDDPVVAAEAWVADNVELLGLDEAGVAALEVIASVDMGQGDVVVLRQTFGGLSAGIDGQIALGIRDGAVWYAGSSLSRDSGAPAPATLTPEEAQAIAAADAGLPTSAVLRSTLVAVPTADGAVAAYRVEVLADADEEPIAFGTYVDARDGTVLVREDLVDHDADNPTWEVFPSWPSTDYSSDDTRVTWCWEATDGCDEDVATSASPLPWDVDPVTGESTLTTNGNNAIAVHNWFTNNAFSVGTETATPAPDRNYDYPFTNQWYEEGCNLSTFESAERNDIDAARANLFAMHNRMHDWSYHLGFTEATWNMQRANFTEFGAGGDPEQGNAQAGGISGSRDNANQITFGDGIAPITNMYLWQPIAGAFYAPCVDGDYDMSIIGHEYGHAITNRMVAGPSAGVSTPQGMSESWSDQIAMEIVNEHGYAPEGLQAYTIGEYATGDDMAGIRNYNMSDSPLNYSTVDYDFVGLQVHASGEVWTATNFDIREAMIARHGAGDDALQTSCANGETPVEDCPGNRMWAQLMFDSFLLLPGSQVSMVDARDAMLAADLVRFGGANQDLLWNAFARRGLGASAASNGSNDADPTPSFASPATNDATITFRPVGEDETLVPGARLFVGDYQARGVAIADTDAMTEVTDQFALTPGTYEFVAVAPGRGHVRVGPLTVTAGQQRDLPVRMRINLASATSGATATGDGINLARLIDDDEATNWASRNEVVAGRQVTVDLAGGIQQVRRVQVSAMLRPGINGDPDNGGQNRFSALRQFRVLSCLAQGSVDCSEDGQFTEVFTSPTDAFPSTQPRPRAPDLIVRSFDIPRTRATHLRFEVVTNQCTGAPDYAGEQDQDPRSDTDCSTASGEAFNVRAAEFQAFAQ
ncbi:M36 family metallopeptidase [Nitriliruptoria bacterium AS10]|nr:M36 family metallopeptidase [Salsipaludibacter albus]